MFDAQKNLALSSNTLNNSEAYSTTWGFLKDWGTLDHDQKLKKYDEYASHELNVFVFFKDPDFFAKVVLPFLYNKIEKSTLDYILLDDKKRLADYAGCERFEHLNSLEQVLMIYRLQKTSPNEAKRLAESLENKKCLE